MNGFLWSFLKEAGLAEVACVAVMDGTKMLMGRRRDSKKWTHPGGHLEPGENSLEGAKRELFEEAGIKATHLKHLTSKKVTTPKGKQLIVHAYLYKTDRVPTTMKGDPDQECERWQWLDCKNGLPKEVAENLHSPDNVLLQALGLQEGKMEKAAFWDGFVKEAEEKPREKKDSKPKGDKQPFSGERMTKWDQNGGASPRDDEGMMTAQQADLITLPKDVQGTNCGNCMHARVIDAKEGLGFCTLLKLDVTDRQCCREWDAPGTYRSFGQPDAAQVEPSQAGQLADSMAQSFAAPMGPEVSGEEPGDPMQQDPVAAAQGQPDMPTAPRDQGGSDNQAKPEKKKKPEPKGKREDKPSGGHSININVNGGKSQEKKAFWSGFEKEALHDTRTQEDLAVAGSSLLPFGWILHSLMRKGGDNNAELAGRLVGGTIGGLAGAIPGAVLSSTDPEAGKLVTILGAQAGSAIGQVMASRGVHKHKYDENGNLKPEYKEK